MPEDAKLESVKPEDAKPNDMQSVDMHSVDMHSVDMDMDREEMESEDVGTGDGATEDTKKAVAPTRSKPEQTRDDTDAGWGERSDEGAQDQWLRDQRPPHWG